MTEKTDPTRGIPESARRIKAGGSLQIGSDAPWLGPYGACLVRVHDMRVRADGATEFGIGNEAPPVLAWVTTDDFPDEWPQ